MTIIVTVPVLGNDLILNTFMHLCTKGMYHQYIKVSVIVNMFYSTYHLVDKHKYTHCTLYLYTLIYIYIYICILNYTYGYMYKYMYIYMCIIRL